MARAKQRNSRLAIVVLLLPLAVLAWALYMIFGGDFSRHLAQQGVERLQTQNWQQADDAFKQIIPSYGRKFAYYKVKENQSLAVLSRRFSVPEAELTRLNPGAIVLGTTVKIPPVEAPLTPEAPVGNLRQTRIYEEDQALHIRNDFKQSRIVTTLPLLAEFLKSYKAIEDVGNGTWRINRAISVDGNIRLDILSEQVKKLELRSSPNNDITCLCFEDAEVLISGVNVTTFDPTTGTYDLDPKDGRSFIRALKSTRMDLLGGDYSYLGNELQDAASKAPIQKDGGTYGISWRIPDGTLGVNIATGWVEGVKFHNNLYGSYTFGASGMMWKNNHYVDNLVYGLDPHDDSNNAMVEGNVFEHNGKHGFIVSKRCNYNVIRNNRSIGNKYHGYMLHQDSVYNVIEDNYAEGNVDNFVIYASDYNMIRNNTSRNALASHVRINEGSANNFVMGNSLVGGRRGVYAYGNTRNVYVAGNTIQTRREALASNGASGLMLTGNTLSSLDLKLAPGDKLIIGENTIQDSASSKAKQ